MTDVPEDEMREKVREMGPWRHDIDLGPFSTYDVAEAASPFDHLGHPKPRADAVAEYLPDPPGRALVLGCNAGGIAFRVEDEGFDVVGIDNGADRNSGAHNIATHPIKQAIYCKERLGSSAVFVDGDARKFFDLNPDVDVVVACGILYHIESVVGERNTEAEQDFVDRLLSSTADRVIIETNDTPWLADYVEDRGATVICDIPGTEARDGVRHFVVFDD